MRPEYIFGLNEADTKLAWRIVDATEESEFAKLLHPWFKEMFLDGKEKEEKTVQKMKTDPETRKNGGK